MKPMSIVLIVSGLIVCAHPAEATVINACVNNSSGTIRILTPPDTCRQAESPLSWNSQEAAPQVVDSTGAVIGSVLSQNLITRQINGDWVVINVQPFGFETFSETGFFSPEFLLYTTDFCTGTAYMSAEKMPVDGVLLSLTGVITGSPTVYYPASPYQTLSIKSSGNPAGQCLSTPGTFLVGQATAITLNFVPPFSTQ
jgi:hypothetical protein